MPLYDFKCKGCCGYFEDMFVLLADMEKAVCPSCDGPLQTIIRGVPVIGPMPSKPGRLNPLENGGITRGTTLIAKCYLRIPNSGEIIGTQSKRK